MGQPVRRTLGASGSKGEKPSAAIASISAMNTSEKVEILFRVDEKALRLHNGQHIQPGKRNALSSLKTGNFPDKFAYFIVDSNLKPKMVFVYSLPRGLFEEAAEPKDFLIPEPKSVRFSSRIGQVHKMERFDAPEKLVHLFLAVAGGLCRSKNRLPRKTGTYR